MGFFSELGFAAEIVDDILNHNEKPKDYMAEINKFYQDELDKYKVKCSTKTGKNIKYSKDKIINNSIEYHSIERNVIEDKKFSLDINLYATKEKGEEMKVIIVSLITLKGNAKAKGKTETSENDTKIKIIINVNDPIEMRGLLFGKGNKSFYNIYLISNDKEVKYEGSLKTLLGNFYSPINKKIQKFLKDFCFQ